MMHSSDMGTRLATIASRIAETLAQEKTAISLVRDIVQKMLMAIREADSSALAAGAAVLQERIRQASELRKAQQRQCALFFRAARLDGHTLEELLAELSRYPEAAKVRQSVARELARIRDIAKETRLLVTAFEQALRFADQINHDLVYMLHGLIKPDEGRVYTARGRTASQQNKRSLLNQVG